MASRIGHVDLTEAVSDLNKTSLNLSFPTKEEVADAVSYKSEAAMNLIVQRLRKYYPQDKYSEGQLKLLLEKVVDHHEYKIHDNRVYMRLKGTWSP
jgi:hypothetical protein